MVHNSESLLTVMEEAAISGDTVAVNAGDDAANTERTRSRNAKACGFKFLAIITPVAVLIALLQVTAARNERFVVITLLVLQSEHAWRVM